jgi:hypothetical protein
MIAFALVYSVLSGQGKGRVSIKKNQHLKQTFVLNAGFFWYKAC